MQKSKNWNSLFGSEITNQFKAIEFNKIKSDDFTQAVSDAMLLARQNIKSIIDSSEPPSFLNTVLALENAGKLLERVTTVFFNLHNCNTDEVIEKQAPEISAKLAEYGNDIQLDEKLFAKIKKVYENKTQLSPDEARLTKDYYESFTRNGALLNLEQKLELRKIDEEQSRLSPLYSQNVLQATNSFELEVKNFESIKNLPESAIEAAKNLAKEKSKPDSWLFNLQAPSYIPFMQYCSDENLRKSLWLAYNQRAIKDNSNVEICQKIANLRLKRAKLLGFKSHADFVLKKRMAKTTDNVKQFLNDLLGPSLNAAKKEVHELSELRQQAEKNPTINPWDFAFYSEILMRKKFDFSEEDLRPYFTLSQVIDGVFLHAEMLYGITFEPRPEIPVYHPDVKVYEVKDKATKKYVGLFYADFFPRESKRGGAWMTNFLDQCEGQRPHVSIVCNFTKPTQTKPSLLSFNEVQTFFHEFGHALHSLLSQGKYATLSGTNVLWDFVELPSQIMENWTYEKESLDLYAQHFETGAKIPQDLIDKLQKSAQFNAGYASLRQVAFGLLDMAWHGVESEITTPTLALEKSVLEKVSVLPQQDGVNSSVTFSHIFAGGYSAGYYSYKWAEVLDADAFDYFKEKGIFNTEVATKFKTEILEKGSSQDPDILYRNFRGRDPNPNALLKRSGLLS